MCRIYMQMSRRLLTIISAYACLMLFFLQIAVVLGSWVASILYPELAIRSMFVGESVRWFWSSLADNMSSTLLVWLLLSGAMAELFVGGGLLKAIMSYKQTTDYERMALIVVAWELVAMVIVLFFLAFVPHAVLLSALGTITPNSYLDSFVIMVIVGVCIMSLTYGMVTGRYSTFVDTFSAAATGVATTAPLVIVYLLAAELYSSVVWIFN